ncbi:hypothetical protein GGE45_004298 [Rhizobium aethiopicum]|nr:hypothetical protein [Rhizobium aethiopicum]
MRGPHGIPFMIALRLRSVPRSYRRSPPHLPAGIFSPLGEKENRGSAAYIPGKRRCKLSHSAHS